MDDRPSIPIDKQSNFQSRTDFLTKRTILLAVMVSQMESCAALSGQSLAA